MLRKPNSSNADASNVAESGVAKKSPTRKRAKATAPRSKKTSLPEASVSDDDIRLRAYFISEFRAENSIPGDSASDWIEARRQLLAEFN